MAAHMARDGRRRRVLNDEARSASSLSLAAYDHDAEADAPRYGEQASIENHPQITDYVPRRKRAVILTMLAGVGAAAGTGALVRFAKPIAAALPGAMGSELVIGVAAGVTAWTSAVALLLCAMLARLTYSLRRHRVDDYAGRYRVWRWVAWGGVLASINSVVRIEGPLASMGVAGTGMSLTAGGAEWWLAPLAVVGGWVAVRLMLEVSESRSSAALLFTAIGCYAAAALGALGWAPETTGGWGGLALAAAPLAGHTCALTSLMIFARYVVLDVQGLIEHRPRTVKPKAERKAETAAAPAATVKLATNTAAAVAKAPAVPTEEADENWYEEEEAEAGGRKLSKAEKKQLRKQQRRAA